MADPNPTINPAADFQALPLEMIIATPLIAVVKAQKAAADATVTFINSFIDEEKKPIAIEFSFERAGALPESTGSSAPAPSPTAPKAVDGTSMVKIKAPILSIVPVPHLRIDSMTLNFKYEITQVFSDKSQTSESISLEAKSGAFLSPWVQATLQGNVSHSSAAEATTNRSGILDITIRASESPIPEGLSRVLSLLAHAIPDPAAAKA